MDCARARVLAHIAKLLLRVFRIFAFSLVRAVPIQECETYIYRKIGALRRLGSSLAISPSPSPSDTYVYYACVSLSRSATKSQNP